MAKPGIRNPGEVEGPEGDPSCSDGLDNDCDDLADMEDLECSCRDLDRDGFFDLDCGGLDCDDTDRQVRPGAEEVCDGKDTDCDGTVPGDEADDDGDGWRLCEGECDDHNPAANPGAEEVCAGGVDEDCDGVADFDDPDCVLTLRLDAHYWSFALNLDFTLGTPVPVRWATILILTAPSFQVVPLWVVPLPEIEPPIRLPTLSFPFPSIGWMGIYTGLYTEEGAHADYLVWTYTG